MITDTVLHILDHSRIRLIEWFYSSLRSYPPLPDRQRPRYGLMLNTSYYTKIL